VSNSKTDRLIAEVLAQLQETEICLGPCVEEAALARFENRNGIRLPTGYREFLLRVGNGGDRLETFDPDVVLEKVGLPFPLTAVWVWDEDPDADDCWNGWIYIGTDGCDTNWVLIVTGPERGQVWEIEGQGAQPCAPARDFLEWYLLWVNWIRAGGDYSGRDWWDIVWADYADK
jgi:SMI1 / KNR4 family (SUKH-1)